MRIALFVHCYLPEHYFGTESYTRLVARNLRDLGHDPVVVTATFAGEPKQADLIERYRIDDIPVLRIDKNVLPHAGLAETYLQPGMAEVQESILREIAPDVVHVTHLINHTAPLLGVCERLAIPVVATFTDFFGFCFNNKLEAADGSLCAGPDRKRANCVACLMRDSPPATPARQWLQGPVARPFVSRLLADFPRLAGADAQGIVDLQLRPDRLLAAYRTYRAALAPSRFLHDAYAANGFENLVLSHFGIDIDRSAKPARSGGPVRLGYIGQLAPHKGVHLLADALRGLDREAFTLDIFGSEAQDSAYSAMLRGRCEGLSVAFKGSFPVETLADVLARLDVIVIPSTWYENSPLILLQALATHTPVVISDVAGMTEFLQPGVNGFAFRRGDAGALAQALRRFIDEPGLAPRMSQTTRYDRTSRDMTEDLLAMYQQHGIAVRP
jgi:glycosyltransferase involved in cell wall biosynthesis